MNKNRVVYGFFISMITIMVTAITLNVGLAIALFDKYANGNGTYGEVSLRSYYESGSGTSSDPFVITRPRHLYNLSRLHGLGLYGEKTYFQLGKVDLGGVDSNDVPMCYASDAPDAAKVPYLDMSRSNLNANPINAVGSEALPFYGDFDGQNVEIKNLNVYANPQDAGLFGYTAHGSVVHDLFLSNITIHALGYTSDYMHLYNEDDNTYKSIRDDTWFVYNPNDNTSSTNISSSYEGTIYTAYYANNLNDFAYTSEGSDPTPTISIHHPNNSYTFTPLLSGDLITTNENKDIIPNLTQLFAFFKSKREEEGITFPIQATSTGSLVVSSVDSYGQKHSKVLLALEFDFTLSSAASNCITMGVRLASDHGNNIGLVVGHCDGTVTDCYVYNGAFEMNNGGSSYYKLSNGSDLGLIGRVGGTVQNILALQSDAGAKEGKNIGILDFSNIYSNIIDENSFPSTDVPAQYVSDGITFTPKTGTKYLQFLRYYMNQYITQQKDTVSFKGREIISKKADINLGVFTIATDPKTPDGSYSGSDLNKSMILSQSEEDLKVNGKYYIYYATGEYNKKHQTDYGISSFSEYLNSYNVRNATTIAPGYYIPSKEQLTRDSFSTREGRQNYCLRFELNPSRVNKNFYLSDVDITTDGGSFFANYFNYKLVDADGYHIPKNDNKCGLMLKTMKNNVRQELDSLSASFALPDLTKKVGNTQDYAFCLQDTDNKKYVGNMINFEVKNKWANVTIIASPTDPDPSNPRAEKCAALGIYKLHDNDFVGNASNYTMYFNRMYNDPDYAFFMPTDDNLAYFDYQYNGQSKKGEIGTYVNGTFMKDSKKATVPAEGDVESNYTTGKTRLFAHTFCLSEGRYCIGSASSGSQYVPKVYYVCAQGQDDGEFDFDETVFASDDRVENVDFLNTPRFANDGTESIVIDHSVTQYNPNDPDTGNNLINRRCYVALVNSRRSLFENDVCYVSFTYDASENKFIVSSVLDDVDTKDAITFIAVNNYNHSWGSPPGTPAKQLTVSLLGNETTGTVIVYPTGD